MPWLKATGGQKRVVSSFFLALLRVLTESQNFLSLPTVVFVIGYKRAGDHG